MPVLVLVWEPFSLALPHLFTGVILGATVASAAYTLRRRR